MAIECGFLDVATARRYFTAQHLGIANPQPEVAHERVDLRRLLQGRYHPATRRPSDLRNFRSNLFSRPAPASGFAPGHLSGRRSLRARRGLVGTGLELLVTVSMEREGRETLDGVASGDCARRLVDAGANVVGINCLQRRRRCCAAQSRCARRPRHPSAVSHRPGTRGGPTRRRRRRTPLPNSRGRESPPASAIWAVAAAPGPSTSGRWPRRWANRRERIYRRSDRISCAGAMCPWI